MSEETIESVMEETRRLAITRVAELTGRQPAQVPENHWFVNLLCQYPDVSDEQCRALMVERAKTDQTGLFEGVPGRGKAARLLSEANNQNGAPSGGVTPGAILARAARMRERPDLDHLNAVLQQRIDALWPEVDVLITVRGIEDLPNCDPDKEADAGVAWRGNLEASGPASLGWWIVCVPGAHPFWSWWLVSVITLKEFPNVPAAQKDYPEAQHEFMIAAIDARSCPNPDPFRPLFTLLRPLDVREQFHGQTDAEAALVAEHAVETIVRGALSPDQDFRAAWKHWLHAGTPSKTRLKAAP